MDKEELKQQARLLFEIMNDPQIVEAIANMTWSIFIKLQEKGFSKEEALQLTIALAQQKGK